MDALVLTSKEDLQRLLDEALDETIPRLLKELKFPAERSKEWLSNREAMDWLDLSKSSLQRYRSSGKLPYSKLGGNVYYRREDLLRVLEEHRVNGNGHAS